MNSVFTIIFVLCALQVAASFRQSFGPSMSEESASMQLLRELQHNMMESAHRPMPRARRVPAPGETRACGRKLISLVMAVCGDLCNPRKLN